MGERRKRRELSIKMAVLRIAYFVICSRGIRLWAQVVVQHASNVPLVCKVPVQLSWPEVLLY